MFQGSMVALVTPMNNDGSIDYASLDKLIEFHVDAKTDAIVAVGTTGESATLTEEEHCAVVRHVVNKAAGRIPVIAGTGSNNTHEAIELTACAKDAGADAVLLVTPYYNKPSQHGLIAHYQAIAAAVDIPQILYNVPGRTACDMQVDTVVELAKVSNIIGIKEATGKVERSREIVQRCGPEFEVYSGDDALGIDIIEVGGVGNISVTANVAPSAMHLAYQAALAGDFKTAREINQPLEALHRDLFVEANPIPVKWALAEMGKIAKGIRLPLTVLHASHHETIRNALKQANLI
ncbi:MAG: 4-hydroxy-tetrahydrodipicolinate synthase [Gammaproteobacteria bacterium]|nr:4-hydroxy-tetrahydrodipicolinate synthase [Gammaproteobacteria bacterium]MDH5731953.1 4-hydroxy-tetrahydrodipicolinate synthase [Gammaproteobacteria bacterium]